MVSYLLLCFFSLVAVTVITSPYTSFTICQALLYFSHTDSCNPFSDPLTITSKFLFFLFPLLLIELNSNLKKNLLSFFVYSQVCNFLLVLFSILTYLSSCHLFSFSFYHIFSVLAPFLKYLAVRPWALAACRMGTQHAQGWTLTCPHIVAQQSSMGRCPCSLGETSTRGGPGL